MANAYISAKLRKEVINRANGRCEYCHTPKQLSSTKFHIDHIISEKHNGPTESENLAWACAICNLNKGPNVSARFYEENILVPLFNPRFDTWTDHFDLDAECRFVALTQIGRGTIKVLKLNLAERIEERKVFLSAGVELT